MWLCQVSSGNSSVSFRFAVVVVRLDGSLALVRRLIDICNLASPVLSPLWEALSTSEMTYNKSVNPGVEHFLERAMGHPDYKISFSPTSATESDEVTRMWLEYHGVHRA